MIIAIKRKFRIGVTVALIFVGLALGMPRQHYLTTTTMSTTTVAPESPIPSGPPTI